MGKIIAVVSGKGGTGKTSFTANVGLALAALGKSTLCLDCDICLLYTSPRGWSSALWRRSKPMTTA